MANEPVKIKFTTAPPTAPGWYLWYNAHRSSAKNPLMTFVTEEDVEYYQTHPDARDGQWSGPLKIKFTRSPPNVPGIYLVKRGKSLVTREYSQVSLDFIDGAWEPGQWCGPLEIEEVEK